MGLASYEIVGGAGEWRVSHEGKAENVYQTKESAFEAAVAAASTGQTGARGTGGLLFAFDEKLAAINTAGVLRRMRPDNESSYGTAASGAKLPVTSVSEVAERTCYSDGLGSLTQLDLGKFAKQSQKRWQPSSYSPMWLLTAYGEPASHSGRLNTSSCNTTRIDVFAVPF